MNCSKRQHDHLRQSGYTTCGECGEALPPVAGSVGDEAFYYDPDYRSRVHPRDITKPYCCRCQRNLDTSKAVAVTTNEETMMALMGHGRAEEIRTNSHPQCRNLVVDGWIGKDCLRKLLKEQSEQNVQVEGPPTQNSTET